MFFELLSEVEFIKEIIKCCMCYLCFAASSFSIYLSIVVTLCGEISCNYSLYDHKYAPCALIRDNRMYKRYLFVVKLLLLKK